MNRSELLPYAEQIVEALRPACVQVVIGGSIRRMKADCKDIEIVALPRWDEDLLGEEADTSAALEEVLRRALADGLLAWQVREDTGNRAGDGARYKKLLLPCLQVKVDLFLADKTNFGRALAIRTGSAPFSEFMMVCAKRRGFINSGRYLMHPSRSTPVPCATEEDYFKMAGVPWVDPAERTEFTVKRMWKYAR